MMKNSVEAYSKNTSSVPASRAIHRHINNGLMSIWSGTVVAITELEGLQALFAAIELHSLAGMTVSDHTLDFRTAGTNHINLCHQLPKKRSILQH